MENIADLSLSALRKTRLSTEIPTALWVENNFVPLSAPYIKDYSILDNGTASSDTSGNRYTPRIKPTIVQYSDGTKIELSITGTLEQNSIPNKENITRIEIGKDVTSIGTSAFEGCSGLTSVTIGNGVTRIGDSAFSSCSGLTSVTIGNGVTSIGYAAFSGCSGLTSVTIGNGVTRIGGNAFSSCSGLTSVTIPDSVTSIGDSAFSGCSGLTSVTIPDSVTSIGSNAFYGCSGLTSIRIPNSVTSIGSLVFSNCSNLTSITVDSDNSVYDSPNNCNAIIQKSNNTLIAGCKNTVIPNSVTSIGGNAFLDCSELTSITIPIGVTSIGKGAFSGCSALSSIMLDRISAPTVLSRAFGNSNFTYTGRNTCSTGNNVLRIPQGATGYDTGAWLDPLQNSSKCGFHVKYI